MWENAAMVLLSNTEYMDMGKSLVRDDPVPNLRMLWRPLTTYMSLLRPAFCVHEVCTKFSYILHGDSDDIRVYFRPINSFLSTP